MFFGYVHKADGELFYVSAEYKEMISIAPSASWK